MLNILHFRKSRPIAKSVSLFKLVFVFMLCFVFICGVALLSFNQETLARGQGDQKDEEEKVVFAFGYDIFKKLPEPITEGPVDEQYLLSPGDEIIINVWGQLSLEYSLTVSEEGYIDIPDEGGRIFTNAVSLKELKGLVTRKLSQIYSSYINFNNPSRSTAFVDVKLAKVRKLLVYVVGEVENQGVYTISSSVATLLNLLNNAGGVKETGSLREIKIRRAGGSVDVVDLYDFLLTGEIDTKKSRIRYNDYIIVPLKGKSVTITGEVKRPGIYEITGDEGIKNLVQFAGGLTSNAYLKRCQIRRHEISVGEKYIDLNIESIFNDHQDDFALVDGDEVTIFPNIVVRKRMVEIIGDGIKRPGTYEYLPGMTIKDLIEKAEGMKEAVFLERADLVRTEEDFSKRLTVFSLKDLFKRDKKNSYVYSGNEKKNFKLIEMDQITIYSSYEMKGEDKHVTLIGHVKEPGTYILPENMTLYDLIFSKGGFQDEGFKKRAYLDLAHIFRKVSGDLEERVITFNLGKLLEGNLEENSSLEDSDRVRIYSYETMETKPFVSIEGLVKRAGIFPLAENMTLEDLILIAGGLRPDAYKVEAVIARMQPEEAEGQKKVATIVVPVESNFASILDEEKTRLETYDKVVIRNLPEWEPSPVVSVEGQVKYPGSYSLEETEERVSSIIRRAGGLKKTAYSEGGVLFRRKDIVEMTRERQNEKRKISINLREALGNPGGPNDFILKDGDQIFVPYNPGIVEVKGAVKNPSFLQYREGKKMDYYIKLCGGYHQEADKSNTIAYLPNNAAYMKKRFLFFRSSPSILPGSTIEVPFKGEIPFRGEEKSIEIVEVRGAVQKPTLAQYRAKGRLDYYINLCGGLTQNADIENIVIYLPSGSSIERKGALTFNPEILPGSIVEIPVRRVEREFETGAVRVRGAVMRPSLIRYRAGEKYNYYIDFCGGLTQNADIENIVIYLPSGSSIERKGALTFNPEILPGSVIEVPLKRKTEPGNVLEKSGE